MKDTLRERLLKVLVTAPNRMTEANINDKWVTYFEVHDVDQILSLIEEEKNKTAGNIYKMGMDIIMEKPASAIVVGGTDLDKLLTQLERKYGKDNIQYAYGDHNEVTEVSK